MEMKYTYLLIKHSFSERGIATLHVSEKKPGVLFSESQETSFSDPTPLPPIPPYNIRTKSTEGLGCIPRKAFRMDMKYTYLLMKHSLSERGIATLHVS